MLKKLPFFAAILYLIILSSCNSRGRQEKQADERLKQIEQLIIANDYNSAKLKIDTINLLFPRLVAKRKIAAAYKDTIIRRESARTIIYCDSILPFKQHVLDSILKEFRFEKNETYQEFGNYVYKSQITEQNTNRNYLKCYVDENADLYFVSNVTGSKTEHFAVQVSVNNLQAQTDTTNKSKGIFHSFTDGGVYWESLTFKNEDDNGISAFIAQHKSERIKVSLLGKKKISYYLSEQDKKAIAATYDLWTVKKEIKQLQKESEKATVRIGRIKLRYEN